MTNHFDLPDWLSPQQKIVLMLFIEYPGCHISADYFCEALYGEHRGKGPAPAKLRVLIQRCRDIIDEITNNRAEVTIRRNSGWKMSRKDVLILKRCLAKA